MMVFMKSPQVYAVQRTAIVHRRPSDHTTVCGEIAAAFQAAGAVSTVAS
jgi:hypothetical protein